MSEYISSKDSAASRAEATSGHVSDDIYHDYANRVGQVPLVIKEEVAALYKRMDAGTYAKELLSRGDTTRYTQDELEWAVSDGVQAYEQMVASNLRLVIYKARRAPRKLPLIDLIQEGNRGLMSAVDGFNPELGFSFSTYAAEGIKKSLVRAVDNQARMIRLPAGQARKVSRKHEAVKSFQFTHGRDPSTDELARELDLSVEEVVDLEKIDRITDTISLETPVGEDDGTLADIVPAVSEEAEGPTETAEQHSLREMLETLLFMHCNRREMEIAFYRYGFYDGIEWTLADIADVYGISHKRVGQILEGIRTKLRLAANKAQLEDYLE